MKLSQGEPGALLSILAAPPALGVGCEFAAHMASGSWGLLLNAQARPENVLANAKEGIGFRKDCCISQDV